MAVSYGRWPSALNGETEPTETQRQYNNNNNNNSFMGLTLRSESRTRQGGLVVAAGKVKFQ